jgi:membrane protease YdiL (CAAX protease family)
MSKLSGITKLRRVFFTGLLFVASAFSLPALAVELTDPLNAGGDIRIVIGRIIRALLGLSGALALLMFVWGGFQWIVSGGEKEKIEKGKRTLVWAVIGLFFIFIAYTVVYALISAITTGAADTTSEEAAS